MSLGNLDLACAIPVSDAQWERQCEIEQDASNEFFLQRAKAGHCIAATVFGTTISSALLAKAFFSPAAAEETCNMLCGLIRDIFKEG
jgi:hypothetical protein